MRRERSPQRRKRVATADARPSEPLDREARRAAERASLAHLCPAARPRPRRRKRVCVFPARTLRGETPRPPRAQPPASRASSTVPKEKEKDRDPEAALRFKSNYQAFSLRSAAAQQPTAPQTQHKPAARERARSLRREASCTSQAYLATLAEQHEARRKEEEAEAQRLQMLRARLSRAVRRRLMATRGGQHAAAVEAAAGGGGSGSDDDSGVDGDGEEVRCPLCPPRGPPMVCGQSADRRTPWRAGAAAVAAQGAASQEQVAARHGAAAPSPAQRTGSGLGADWERTVRCAAGPAVRVDGNDVAARLLQVHRRV